MTKVNPTDLRHEASHEQSSLVETDSPDGFEYEGANVPINQGEPLTSVHSPSALAPSSNGLSNRKHPFVKVDNPDDFE